VLSVVPPASIKSRFLTTPRCIRERGRKQRRRLYGRVILQFQLHIHFVEQAFFQPPSFQRVIQIFVSSHKFGAAVHNVRCKVCNLCIQPVGGNRA
jgi:hypothetical protein